MQGDTKTLLKRFCTESTVLGLKYLYIYPDFVSRVFWIGNILFAYGVAAVLLVNLYFHFIDIPTRITLENQYEPLGNVSLPAITLCSPLQITTEGMAKVAKELNTNPDIKLDVALKILFGNAELLLDISSTETGELDRLVNQTHYKMNDIILMMPQKCEDFLKLCFFRGAIRNCKTLFHPILTQRGLCCSFNNVYRLAENKINKKNPRFRSIQAADFIQLAGLQVIVDYEPTKAVNKTIMNAGLSWLMFNHYEEFPSEDQVFFVHGNTEVLNNIRITYTFCSDDVKQLPAWSRKCYFAEDGKLPYFGNYYNEDCDTLCFISAVKENCGCLMFYVPNARPDQICNFSQLLCVRHTRDNIGKYYIDDQCVCPRNCESVSYDIDANTGNLRGLPYMLHPIPMPMKESSTLLWFFMQRPVYKKQKQETTISLTTAIANLGGVFGLCLGCSIMSVLEFLFYVYSAIKNRMEAKRRIRSITPK